MCAPTSAPSRISELRREIKIHKSRIRELSLELAKEFEHLVTSHPERSLFDLLEEHGEPPPKSTSETKSFYCESCRGYRPHLAHKEVEGDIVMLRMRCQICESDREAHGMYCKVCGETRFYTWKVEQMAPWLTIKTVRCANRPCPGRLRLKIQPTRDQP